LRKRRLDDGPGLLDGADRVLLEVLLQGALVLDQGGPWASPRAATEELQPAFEIFIEVALDGASRDVGIGGDPVMTQPVALEPEHLELALDAGFGVMEAVVGQGSPVVLGEVDGTHGEPTP
jgi:hypothetical protein